MPCSLLIWASSFAVTRAWTFSMPRQPASSRRLKDLVEAACGGLIAGRNVSASSCIRNQLLKLSAQLLHATDRTLRRSQMKLDGMHHLTMITGDARKNVEFYADVLGLRLVKKTVNFDAPDAYHLYFGDESGAPGSILTWFEFQGARRGQAGAGMIHTIQLGVASEDALDFWAERLRREPGR